MKIVIGLLKLILKIVAAPVVVVLTVAIWMCVGIVYVCGLVRKAVHSFQLPTSWVDTCSAICR